MYQLEHSLTTVKEEETLMLLDKSTQNVNHQNNFLTLNESIIEQPQILEEDTVAGATYNNGGLFGIESVNS